MLRAGASDASGLAGDIPEAEPPMGKRKHRGSASSSASSVESEPVMQGPSSKPLPEKPVQSKKTAARAGTSAPVKRGTGTSKKLKLFDDVQDYAVEAQQTQQKKIDAQLELEKAKIAAQIEIKKDKNAQSAELRKIQLENDLKVRLAEIQARNSWRVEGPLVDKEMGSK